MSKQKCYLIDKFYDDDVVVCNHVFLDKDKAEKYFDMLYLKKALEYKTTKELVCSGKILRMFTHDADIYDYGTSVTYRLRELEIKD